MSTTKQERLTLRHIVEEIGKVFNLEKGIFLTIKDLWIKPGLMIRQYIAGERIKYTRPVQFVVVLVGIYTFAVLQKDWSFYEVEASYYYNQGYQFGSNGKSPDTAEIAAVAARLDGLSEEIIVFFRKYLNLIMFAIIPYVAFFTYIFYKKQQWNYAEHLVLNSYLTGAQSAIYILLFPIALFSTSWYGISSIIAVLYNVWFYQQVFNEGSSVGWRKSFGIVFMLTVVFMLLFFLVGAVWAIIKLT